MPQPSIAACFKTRKPCKRRATEDLPEEVKIFRADEGQSTSQAQNQPIIEETDKSTIDYLAGERASVKDSLVSQELTITDITNRINQPSRLVHVKHSIARVKNCEEKLSSLQKQDEANEPQIQNLQNIQIEVPRRPIKVWISPTTSKELLNAGPRRRLQFKSKESTQSSANDNPTKPPAYQQYFYLVKCGSPALPLPYDYKFLNEIFQCVEMVSAMLFNRKERITFKKLKPAVQASLHHNFFIDHLAQIKTIYPEAYEFKQEKHHSFGTSSYQDDYELVLTPVLNEKSGQHTTGEDNVLKSAMAEKMSPSTLLDRQRKFYESLVERVKDEHQTFLISLETPTRISKEKIMRWHPMFNLDSCKSIAKADLPQPPNTEKATSAQHVLDVATSLSKSGTRMGNTSKQLTETQMAFKCDSSEQTEATTQISEDGPRKVDIPLALFNGIPKALLEKVRARQAAKALEAKTRNPDADKEAAMYSRVSQLAKILRNIFIAERKNILTIDFLFEKLNNSLGTKLTRNELEDHVQLLCKLLPTWTRVQNIRSVDYLKLNRDP